MVSATNNDDDDDDIQLSAKTLAALQEFYDEQQNLSLATIQEDWQLSQFWYDDTTANILSQEAIRASGNGGSIACISCPTIYKRLQDIKPLLCTTKLFEFDKRFSIYGTDFVFYDYNDPLNEGLELFRSSFEVVIADPPFLSEECLTKISTTVRALAKDKIILCTGAIMENLALQLLNLRVCQFQPKHAKNLGNEFRCYANYELDNYLMRH